MTRFLVFQANIEIHEDLTEAQIEKLSDNVIAGISDELESNRKDGLIDDFHVTRTQNEVA